MIRICVEPYCDGCPDFQAETEMHIDYKGEAAYTHIYCAEREKCNRLYDHIKRAGKKQ